MSEYRDIPTEIEEPKPKRKYVRRKLFNHPAVDEYANDLVEKVIDSAAEEISDGPDVGIEVEEIGVAQEIKFLGAEPVNDSLKARVARKLGLLKTMELKPWAKKDRWVCSQCKWQTFDAQRANMHRC